MNADRCSERVKTARERRLQITIACCLAVLSLAIFLQTVNFEFVSFDDNVYVYDNPHVLRGLSLPGVRRALTTFHESNWHPLTWISLMADAQVSRWLEAYGIEIGNTEAGVYHLTNVLLHTVNVLLLFFLLNSTTVMRWRSAFVAAVFAVHPLHVESVAWVTERKDVLSTLFWLLTMLFYLRFVARPDRAGYALVAGTFVLGLMAKPMLVTLPVVLLLIDLWPLGRMRISGDENGRQSLVTLVKEKIPLFVLALISCVVTFWAQRAGGAVVKMEWFPFLPRLLNALLSYKAYALKMLWPVGLGVFYPMKPAIVTREVAGAAAFITLATVIAVRSARNESLGWLTVGWLWYVITLLPVIGLVQVGMQAMADRYTYIPLIGLFVIAAWGIPMVVHRIVRPPIARTALVAAAAAAAIVSLGVLGYVQTGYWRTSTTLFGRTLRVTGNNYFAHVNYAAALEMSDRLDEALRHYRAAA
ncbi:MAG: glycosyltransferase family 39 protein, partial [Armatimonadota bacterium]